jgi:UDP-N-acetylglucosamine--N-acetylmuramyl-(pentapeptide) pyrophosphoryl-undecaprenol N-acetylglucosamine transferase
VPYPYSAEGHQEINARAFQEAGASTIILDRELSGKTLANAILAIADDERARDEMAAQAQSTSRPEAAEAIVDVLFGVVFGQSPQT